MIGREHEDEAVSKFREQNLAQIGSFAVGSFATKPKILPKPNAASIRRRRNLISSTKTSKSNLFPLSKSNLDTKVQDDLELKAEEQKRLERVIQDDLELKAAEDQKRLEAVIQTDNMIFQRIQTVLTDSATLIKAREKLKQDQRELEEKKLLRKQDQRELEEQKSLRRTTDLAAAEAQRKMQLRHLTETVKKLLACIRDDETGKQTEWNHKRGNRGVPYIPSKAAVAAEKSNSLFFDGEESTVFAKMFCEILADGSSYQSRAAGQMDYLTKSHSVRSKAPPPPISIKVETGDKDSTDQEGRPASKNAKKPNRFRRFLQEIQFLQDKKQTPKTPIFKF